MAGPNVDFRITGDDKLLRRALLRSEKEVDRLKEKLRDAGRTSKSTFDKGISSIAQYAGSFLSITAAIGGVNQAYRTWLNNIQEVAGEAKKATDEMLVFLALQEGGTKAQRAQEMIALALRHGITERGIAFDVGQSIESALGDWEKAKPLIETVFAAKKVGIPIGIGKELVSQAIVQGVDPATFMRQAYIAGQAALRDPETIAAGSRALLEYQDKVFGMASLAVIAGPYGQQAEVYTRQAAIALSQVGGGKEWQGLFKKLGVAEATREQRLYALYEAGYREPEELALAGLTEIRQRQAVSVLLKNIPKLEEVRTSIAERDRPGLFLRERLAVEREDVKQRTAREIDELNAQLKEAQASGKLGEEALETLKTQRIRALAFRRMGVEQALGFDVISEEGVATQYGVARYLLKAALGWRPEKGWRPIPEQFAVEAPPGLTGLPSSTARAFEALSYEMHLVCEELRQNREALFLSPANTQKAVRDGVREGMAKTTLSDPDQEPP